MTTGPPDCRPIGRLLSVRGGQPRSQAGVRGGVGLTPQTWRQCQWYLGQTYIAVQVFRSVNANPRAARKEKLRSRAGSWE